MTHGTTRTLPLPIRRISRGYSQTSVSNGDSLRCSVRGGVLLDGIFIEGLYRSAAYKGRNHRRHLTISARGSRDERGHLLCDRRNTAVHRASDIRISATRALSQRTSTLSVAHTGGTRALSHRLRVRLCRDVLRAGAHRDGERGAWRGELVGHRSVLFTNHDYVGASRHSVRGATRALISYTSRSTQCAVPALEASARDGHYSDTRSTATTNGRSFVCDYVSAAPRYLRTRDSAQLVRQ